MQYAMTVVLGFAIIYTLDKPLIDATAQSIINSAAMIDNPSAFIRQSHTR